MRVFTENNQNFVNIKELIVRTSRCRKERSANPEYSTPLPEEIRIQLTTNCNLRCKHCFQWSSNGYYAKNSIKTNTTQELPFSTLEKLLKQTWHPRSSIYFWGGEPLIYSYWDSLTALLENDNRSKVISTNGIHVREKIDDLNKISDSLEVVFSLDGLEKEHDCLRGKGMFNKTFTNITGLVNEKKEGRFKGKITINCSIHNELVNNLYQFVEFCNTLQVDKVILGFPWYINENTCKEMDEYYQINFNWLNRQPIHYTWHCFNYCIDFTLLSVLENEIKKITNRTYNFTLRFHPDLKNDLSSILTGDVFNDGKNSCIATSCRMAVWANGDVSFCGDFPEFCIGNLYFTDFGSIWRSENFNKIRRIINSVPKPYSLCQRCRFSSNNLT